MLIKSNRGYFWHDKPITAEEYTEILAMFRNRPIAPDGYGYKLTESLEWELYELPAVEETDDEISGDELLSMIEEVL